MKRYHWVSALAVATLILFVVLGKVASTARDVGAAAEATERATNAAVEASDALQGLDSINVDSVRAKAERLGGALGAGVRAMVDSARGGRK